MGAIINVGSVFCVFCVTDVPDVNGRDPGQQARVLHSLGMLYRQKSDQDKSEESGNNSDLS